MQFRFYNLPINPPSSFDFFCNDINPKYIPTKPGITMKFISLKLYSFHASLTLIFLKMSNKMINLITLHQNKDGGANVRECHR